MFHSPFFVCGVVGCKYNLFVPKTRKIVDKYNIFVATAIMFVRYKYFINTGFLCMNLQFLCSQLYGGRQIAVGCSRSFVAPVDVFSQCMMSNKHFVPRLLTLCTANIYTVETGTLVKKSKSYKGTSINDV